MEWPRGKVLGGSSAINGLYLIRPTEYEINAWQEMLGDMDGADNWGWESLDAAIKKSETFTPPSAAIAQEADITWNAASHGTSGPIHNSYPGYTFPYIADFIQSAADAGVVDTNDAYGGSNVGAFVATSAINPANWTRSYSRTGYLDPLPPRSNYDVLPNAWVTKLLFNNATTNLTATGVQYTMDGGATFQSVKVKKEVILAGGTVGSPTVLQYSGVGPASVLSAAGVPVVLDLPGVGQHLQDHLSIEIQFNTSEQTDGAIYAAGGAPAASPEFLSYVNDGVAYVNSTVLFGSSVVDSMQPTIESYMNNYAPAYVSDTVTAGFQAIYETVSKKIWSSPVGQVELLIGNNLNGAINLGASLQHPLSQGSININSSNPMDYPAINPNYLSNPNDAAVLVAALQLIRRIATTGPLAGIMTEVWPGSSVQSAAELDEWMRPNCFTEYHPSSTCAMLPLDQGGVVDANLLVYGLSNVRVADASVPPIDFSAHLMASTYGIAEQASDIIKAHWLTKKAPAAVASSHSSGDSASSSTAHKSGGEAHHGGSAKSAGATAKASLVSVVASLAVVAGFMCGFP